MKKVNKYTYYIGSQDAPIKKGQSEEYYLETFKKD